MVIVVGAGLSGLLIGYRLKNEGIPFKILEGRDRIGGRIHTIQAKQDTPVEMGATWFNSGHRHLIQLLDELDISYFKQYMKGTSYFQRFRNAPPEAVSIPTDSPSYRIEDGTVHLLNKLYEKLNKEDVLFNQTVAQIESTKNSIKVKASETLTGRVAVLALPPKLWVNNISFKPNLSRNLMDVAGNTHTWMEDSIKVALVYKSPFWRNTQKSGTLFSSSGPLTEFYDHCDYRASKFSLCGFAHPGYAEFSTDQRKESIIQQLKLTFGHEATEFIDYKECIWQAEKNTYYNSSPPLYPHQNNGDILFAANEYDNRLIFSGTETSPHYGGYMEGAVYSANSVIDKIKRLRL